MDLCEFVTMFTCYCSFWGADGWPLDFIGLKEGPEFNEFISQGVCYLTDGEMEIYMKSNSLRRRSQMYQISPKRMALT